MRPALLSRRMGSPFHARVAMGDDDFFDSLAEQQDTASRVRTHWTLTSKDSSDPGLKTENPIFSALSPI